MKVEGAFRLASAGFLLVGGPCFQDIDYANELGTSSRYDSCSFLTSISPRNFTSFRLNCFLRETPVLCEQHSFSTRIRHLYFVTKFPLFLHILAPFLSKTRVATSSLTSLSLWVSLPFSHLVFNSGCSNTPNSSIVQ